MKNYQVEDTDTGLYIDSFYDIDQQYYFYY